MVPGMRLIVSLYVQCLYCYVMSPVCCTFFSTRELGLSLQVPAVWNEPLINNRVWLTSQRASNFRIFSVLVLLFTSRHDEHTRRLGSLLGADESLRKATISFVMSVCPSVPMVQLVPTRRIFRKFYIVYFWKKIMKIKFSLKSLHEDQYIFLIISRSVLLRMKNVLDKNSRGNQNTHFIFSIGFSEILPFVR
jgi:hypothetical protein